MSHYHWSNNRHKQTEQPNDAKLGKTDEPRGGVGQTAMERIGPHPAARPTIPDSSTPSTPPSLKGILKKAMMTSLD